MVGFGCTQVPEEHEFSVDGWIAQLVGLLDALELSHVDVVGNSFGGALALHLARAVTRVE